MTFWARRTGNHLRGFMRGFMAFFRPFRTHFIREAAGV
jgi:hypothetical protein